MKTPEVLTICEWYRNGSWGWKSLDEGRLLLWSLDSPRIPSNQP